MTGFCVREMRREYRGVSRLYTGTAMLFLLAFACLGVVMRVRDADARLRLLLIGLVNTGLAYVLYFSGLQKLPGQSVALISYIDPVSALVFSALILHESMTVLQIIGAVFIIGGAMLGELRVNRDGSF